MNAAEFVLTHGRCPHLGDDVAPWEYKGWLLLYIQALHAHPGCSFPDRWGYLAALHADEDPGAIPEVHFDKAAPAVLKHLRACVEIAGSYGARGWGWTAWRLFLEWLGWGLGVSSEPPALDAAVNEQLYRTFNAGLLLEAPYDYLGLFICEERGTGFNPNAFYPTPHTLVHLMTEMTLTGADRYQEVNDCCLGTGRMLLHAGNHCLFLSGNDIDPMMVLCTKINGALYVPWMVKRPPGQPTRTLRRTAPPPPPPRSSL